MGGWFGTGVFAQRFSSAGVPVGAEFQVNAYTNFVNQAAPAVAASASGDFVVVWLTSIVYEQSYSIFAGRFSSAGTPLATELQVNTYSTGFHRLPDVAASADGDFVVVWTGPAFGDWQQVLFARRFSSAGAALSSE